ncbi:MerR family transcriptional regulator [Actinoplanes sp. RD1]|uniref:MerR family transcriptional regulator n=1 Tax=Actinoplanes sp. RD1 TaxID=3064538 RepID=UPI002740DE25|nr:MerR family transcriptional regulator [Actinoplanes sp. RD1]
MTATLGIRELAELTGLTPHTLRWYERAGILPRVARTADGRRRYDPEAVKAVRLVQALRRTGMPVAEIRTFVGFGPGTPANTRRRIEVLRRQEAELHRRLAELHDDLAILRAKIDDYHDIIATGRDCETDILTAFPAPRRTDPARRPLP